MMSPWVRRTLSSMRSEQLVSAWFLLAAMVYDGKRVTRRQACRLLSLVVQTGDNLN